MPIKVKFSKKVFTLPDTCTKSVDSFLETLGETELREICPEFFGLTYVDLEGDEISVLTTEDLQSFIEYTKANKKPRVLQLKKVDQGFDSLSLPQEKSIDQLVQEQVEKQLEASVVKLKTEMAKTVKQLVNEKTKQMQKNQIKLQKEKELIEQSQQQLQKEQKQQQEKLEQSQSKILSQPSGEVFEMVSPKLAQLQQIQALILSAQTIPAAKEHLDKFQEINDLIHQELVLHLQSLKKQSISVIVQASTQAKKAKAEEDRKKEEQEQEQRLQNLKEAAAKQAESAKQQAQQQQVPQPVQQPVKSTLDPAVVKQRAQNLSIMFGFDNTIIEAMIKGHPEDNDDHIINILLDQFK